jgi:GMP synthase (glutamine-hydrolysing)
MSARFLIIKTGKTWDVIRERHGCFDDWMCAGLGVSRAQIDVVSVFEGGLLPASLDGIDGIVITGSPAMVTELLPWSEAVARWLAFEIRERRTPVPMIGVCYGHQLLAHALGGTVNWNPRGREIGTVEIAVTAAHDDDPLFAGLATFDAHVTHLQSAITLPPGAVHLACSAMEPHQAFRFGSHVWGVQFHPEFSSDIMRAYVDVLAERMSGEGIRAEDIHATVRNAPQSNRLLRRFAAFAAALRSAT